MARAHKTSNWRFLAFALPGVQTAIVHGPVGLVVPSIYATEFGLSLAVTGAAIFISRILDVVIDPAIGFLSDHTQTRIGRRKPWIVGGAVLTMLATWFLFVPPPHPSLAYFFVWYVAVYFAWTLCEIPHAAWGFEITREYAERSRVLSFRVFATAIGSVLFLLIPFLPIFRSTAITGETLRFIAILALALVPVTVGAAVLWAPEGAPLEASERYGLMDLVALVRGNRALIIFLAGFIFSGFAEGMSAGLAFLYFTNFLGMAKQYPVIGLVQLVSAMAIMPFTPWILARFGRLRVWAANVVLGIALFLLVLLLPHSPAALPYLVPITVVLGAQIVVRGVAALGVLGDLVDFDTLRTGKKRAAIFTALYALVVKLNAAVGASAAMMIVGFFGYQPKLGLGNSAHAQLGMQLAFVVIPSLLYAAALVFIATFPIHRRRQAVISRRLDQREARAVRLAAATIAAAPPVLAAE
ncbi:MAG TPA: MFS transporter [Phenylobacterium sp.]|jgi:Na+/melibiose symporter-like transporter|uniref:MFS transporter n=1 Tax=Phenylobacterium sp. TaxID=1871053 RepID=UPI002D3ECCC5|nr:MFS transporter [Phenylobacterium sp.]HZZ69768.1 MFS transporter [Phenylobacterium sp.]